MLLLALAADSSNTNEKGILGAHRYTHEHSVPSPGQLMTQSNILLRAGIGLTSKVYIESHSLLCQQQNLLPLSLYSLMIDWIEECDHYHSQREHRKQAAV